MRAPPGNAKRKKKATTKKENLRKNVHFLVWNGIIQSQRTPVL